MYHARHPSHSCHSYHYGVILRVNPSISKKILLLDHREGMIDVYLQNTPYVLQHGRLIRYALSKRKSFFVIQDIELIAEPAVWAQSDIFFLHHVLEIAATLLAPHNPSADVFDLFTALYQTSYNQFCLPDRAFFKKCFLAKLFALVGIYPENNHSCPHAFSPELFRLISGSLDTMVRSAPNPMRDEQISQWLKACVAVHPEVNGLKTAVFFTYLDHYET